MDSSVTLYTVSSHLREVGDTDLIMTAVIVCSLGDRWISESQVESGIGVITLRLIVISQLSYVWI
jgi:hypothetical protein